MNALKAKSWAVMALISLAINLFLGGLLAGRLLRPDRQRGDMGPISLFRASRDLDPGSREIIHRVRKQHADRIRASMGRAGKARNDAIEALCAEDFDETRAREAFRAFRKEMGGAQDEMHESLIEVAKEMTPEQRSKLSEVLRRRRDGRHGRPGPGGRFHGDRPGRGGSPGTTPSSSAAPVAPDTSE